MNIRCFIGECLRPFVRCLPFGRVRVLALFGARKQDAPSWRSLRSPIRCFFDRGISAYVAVTLTDWGGRWHYFTGRYYDQANQLLIKQSLREGDTYIDIGANQGIHTLAASRAVGETGAVIAIEPNPETFAHLRAHLAINRITNVRPINAGLSDQQGELVLNGTSDHSGSFTFRAVSQSLQPVKVSVFRGDQLIDRNLLRGRVLVKIDTEGFEHRVLRGINDLMACENIAFVIEITDDWLRQTGSSAAELYNDLRARGFQSYRLKLAYPWFRPVLKLEPITIPPQGQHDALFFRPGFLPPALSLR